MSTCTQTLYHIVFSTKHRIEELGSTPPGPDVSEEHPGFLRHPGLFIFAPFGDGLVYTVAANRKVEAVPNGQTPASTEVLGY